MAHADIPQTRGSLKIYETTVDRMVLAIGIVSAVVVISIATGWWIPIYASIPVIFTVMLLLPCIGKNGRFSAAAGWTVAFTAIIALLMLGTALFDTSHILIAGLPLGSAIFLFGVWPFAVIAGGLLYAFVFSKWFSTEELVWTESEV